MDQITHISGTHEADPIDRDRIKRLTAAARDVEQIAQMRIAGFVAFAPTAYVFFVLRNDIPRRYLVAWAGWVLTVALIGVVHSTLFLRRRPADARPWLIRQIALRAAAGLGWGMTAVFALESAHVYSFVGMVVVAVFSIASIGLLPHRVAGLAWTVSIWTPPTIVLLVGDLPFARSLLVGMLVLLVSHQVYSVIYASAYEQALVSRFEAQLLAESIGESAQRITQLARIDDLTGCLTRREGLAIVQTLWGTADHPALIVVDVDHFKRVNDNHGHGVGDLVLATVGERLRAGVRPGDFVARLGGEEFLVCLPAASDAAAERIAERLRGSVAEIRVESGQVNISVTISGGVAFAAQDPTPELGIARADEALYRAKHRGRNRVQTAVGPGRRRPRGLPIDSAAS